MTRLLYGFSVYFSESAPVEAKEPWLKQAHALEEHHAATEEPT